MRRAPARPGPRRRVRRGGGGVDARMGSADSEAGQRREACWSAVKYWGSGGWQRARSGWALGLAARNAGPSSPPRARRPSAHSAALAIALGRALPSRCCHCRAGPTAIVAAPRTGRARPRCFSARCGHAGRGYSVARRVFSVFSPSRGCCVACVCATYPTPPCPPLGWTLVLLSHAS